MSLSAPPAAPPSTRSPAARLTLLVIGSLLWAVVAVVAVAAIRNRKSENELPTAKAAVAAPDAVKPIPIVPEDPKKEVADIPMWNQKGIADFAFTERSGKTVTKADLLGHPWVVCFVFTKCAGPCLSVSGSMAKLQEALKDTDVRLVTLTVDPKRDTPDVLKNYAEGFGADSDRWLFLTGEKEKLHRLIMKDFLMPVQELEGEERKEGWEVLHTTNILLVDEKGVVQAKYDGKHLDQVEALIERLTGPAVAEVPEAAQ